MNYYFVVSFVRPASPARFPKQSVRLCARFVGAAAVVAVAADIVLFEATLQSCNIIIMPPHL